MTRLTFTCRPGRAVIAVALAASLTSAAEAATLSLSLMDRSSGRTPETTLTLNFGNSTDNAAAFSGLDLVSRSFSNLASLGPVNLVNNVGLYPTANLANTTPTISGTVTSSGVFNFGFSYREIDPSLGFVPITLDRVTGSRLRGPALWTAIDGFFPNFYVETIAYNATGTADDFKQLSAVPVPAALPLLAGGLGILGLFGWRRKRSY